MYERTAPGNWRGFFMRAFVRHPGKQMATTRTLNQKTPD
jgi:hypothetical protein